MITTKIWRSATRCLVAAPLVLVGATVECDQKEEVLDVETPDSELEVEEDPDTGEVDVEVNEN